MKTTRIFQLLLLLFCGLTANAKDILIKTVDRDLSTSFTQNIVDQEGETLLSTVDFSKVRYEKLTGRVLLKIDHNSRVYQAVDFQTQVTVRITPVTYKDGVTITSTPFERTLSIEYARDRSFNDVVYEDFNLLIDNPQDLLLSQTVAPEFLVEIIDAGDPAYHKNVKLALEIEGTRYTEFDETAIHDLTISGQTYNSRNELFVTWEPIQGAEEYELEWTYVNNVGEEGSNLLAASVPFSKNYFRNNATRVTIFGTSYRAPVLYEQGFVAFRIRAIGIHEQNRNLFVYGKWTSDAPKYESVVTLSDYGNDETHNGTIGYAQNFFNIQNGHYQAVNWQSTINFAEEGKNKVAISYFDGSLRNRQVVSRINTEDETIVGETVYDFEGRPAVQILPVPTNSEKIEFTPNFNQNEAGDKFSAQDFDNANTIENPEDCQPTPQKLSNQSGAGKYYSPNVDIKEEKDNYIPDAKGYAYTQIEYTADNTGRIARQSGVGETHTLNSGHETKYFYLTPSPEELTRLFGNEVGDAVHYKKNMVQDANGQVSVSYLDAQGRVIATALAGNNPENLEAIYDEADFTDEIDIDLSRNRVVKGETELEEGEVPTERDLFDGSGQRTGLEYTKTVGVTEDNASREFSYNLSSPNFDIENCDLFNTDVMQSTITGGDQCYGCVIDVTIKLVDVSCGKTVMELNETTNQAILDLIRSETGYTIPAPDVSGSTQEDVLTVDRATLNATGLKVGDYSIIKVLTINQEALDYYETEYMKSTCVLPYDSFFVAAQKRLEVEFDCDFDCENCAATVGDYNTLYNPLTTNGACDPCLTYEDYEELIAQCEEVCSDRNRTCDSYLSKMLDDVSPNGQYGMYLDVDGSSSDESVKNFKLSVYNPENELPQGEAYWKNPILHEFSGLLSQEEYDALSEADKQFYYNDQGEKATVEVTVTPLPEPTAENPEGFITNLDIDPDQLGNYLIEIQARLDEFPSKSFTIRVYPQDLDKLSDFVLSSDPSWFHSLVSYHPEYPNFIFCQNNPEYYSFEDQIKFYEDIADFEANIDLATFLSAPWETDPYTPANSQNRIEIINSTTNFKEDPDGNYYSMLDIAWITAFCADDFDTDDMVADKCGVFENNCGKQNDNLTPQQLADFVRGTNLNTLPLELQNVSEEDRENFLRLYVTLYSGKRDLLFETRFAIYSTLSRSFNACVGNQNFQGNLFNFNTPVIVGYDIQRPRTWFGRFFGQTTVTPIYSSPYYEEDQMCSVHSKDLYLDKQQVFLTGFAAQNGLGIPEIECPESTVALNPNVDLGLEDEGLDIDLGQIDQQKFVQNLRVNNCYEKDQAILQAIEVRADQGFIDNCGQCPISADLSTFLSEAVANEYLTTPVNNLDITCGATEFESFFPSTDVSFYNNSVEQRVLLTTQNNNSTRESILTFTDEDGDDVIFHIFFNDVYRVTDYADPQFIGQETEVTGLSWNDVSAVCCMSYLESSNITFLDNQFASTAYDGKRFSIGARLKDDRYDNQFIRLEGYIEQTLTPGIQLDECDMTTCEGNTAANDLAGFLTAGVQTVEYLPDANSTTPVTESGILLTNGTEQTVPLTQSFNISAGMVRALDASLETYEKENLFEYNYYLNSSLVNGELSIDFRVENKSTNETFTQNWVLKDASGSPLTAASLATITQVVSLGAATELGTGQASKTIKLLVQTTTGIKTYELSLPYEIFTCSTIGYQSNISE